MNQSVELSTGQSGGLPANSYLEARLTGVAGGVRLRVVADDGAEVAEARQADGEASVRPMPGTIRLTAEPMHGTAFDNGARLGIEVRTGAGASMSSTQILVSELDVGAYSSVELAHCEYDASSGWQVTAGRRRETSAFDFLTTAPAPAELALDERRWTWIGPGRYAVREARRGSSASSPTGQPWALIVDSSASMRALFNETDLQQLVELVSGIVAEITGKLPVMAGVSGRLRPGWFPAALEKPRILVPEALSRSAPASWTLLQPALSEAVASGAQVVAVLVDGPPADLGALVGFSQEHPALSLLILVAARRDPDVSAQSDEEEPVELLPFAGLAGRSQIRCAAFPHVPGAAPDARAATAVASILSGANQ